MRTSEVRRYALPICVAALMLAGCRGGFTPLSPSTAGGAAERARPSVAYKVLYSFDSSDGKSPVAGVIDANGTLYGTTFSGGAHDFGTAFSLDPKTKAEHVLHSFGSGASDGHTLEAGVIDVNGTLYGTTYGGGANGDGTVFSLDPKNKAEKVLHSFSGGSSGASSSDGGKPAAGVIDEKRTLYGTTFYGGADGEGTVFSLNPKTKAESVLHSFGSSAYDGRWPAAGVIDVNGTLYGTTQSGGANGDGIVFSLNAKTGAERVLHNFGSGTSDGQEPVAGLIDVNGTLYGTTYSGGAKGRGTVFSLDLKTKAEKVVHSFGSGASDGESPEAGVIDVKGTLYGTTYYGGANGDGTVFSLNPKSKAEKVLHSFGSGSSDGRVPQAGVIDASGTLYGTTVEGGAHGYGTVFAVTP